jgi:hypothetical protein
VGRLVAFGRSVAGEGVKVRSRSGGLLALDPAVCRGQKVGVNTPQGWGSAGVHIRQAKKKMAIPGIWHLGSSSGTLDFVPEGLMSK